MMVPRQACLQQSIRMEPFGGDVVKVADVNDDGQMELLVLQTAGQLSARVYGNREDMSEADRGLYCLTACALNGRVLWQDGTPYDGKAPFTCHGADRMLAVADIDGDGVSEVAVVGNGQLVVLDGVSGKRKAAMCLPSDNFTAVFTARLRGAAAGRQLICKVNDLAYPPWHYGNPIIVLNADLSVYKEPFSVRGAGHHIVAADINADGFDEVFIGYSLFDADVNEVWRLDLGATYDYAKGHADDTLVADVDGDGACEVYYCASRNLIVASLTGTVLKTIEAAHCQTVRQGAWGRAGERRLIVSEKHRGVWGMTPAGTVVWRRRDLNGYATDSVRWHRDGDQTEWPLFQPRPMPREDVPYVRDPAASHALWPVLLGADGQEHTVFPWQDEYAQPQAIIRAKRGYDCGVGYRATVADVDLDGLDEVIIYDRRAAWVFHSPDS